MIAVGRVYDGLVVLAERRRLVLGANEIDVRGAKGEKETK